MMSEQILKIDTEAEQAIFEDVLAGAIDATVESIKSTRERINGYQSLTVSALWHGWCWRAAKAMQDDTAPTLKWISTDEAKPGLSDDVIVTILIDGTDTDWRAGFWDGQHWYTLDTEIDEPIQVNAGCNFVVTHWARVTPAEVAV